MTKETHQATSSGGLTDKQVDDIGDVLGELLQKQAAAVESLARRVGEPVPVVLPLRRPRSVQSPEPNKSL